jgi:cytochrome c551/c552
LNPYEGTNCLLFRSISSFRRIKNVGLALRHFVLFTALLVPGCSYPENGNPTTSAQTGITAIKQLGCGACHDIPGVSWPRSHVGPSLENFGDRNLIAGVFPNTPDNLAVFVQNATRFVPDGAMPPIAMTSQQAEDIALYLLSLQDEG